MKMRKRGKKLDKVPLNELTIEETKEDENDTY